MSSPELHKKVEILQPLEYAKRFLKADRKFVAAHTNQKSADNQKEPSLVQRGQAGPCITWFYNKLQDGRGEYGVHVAYTSKGAEHDLFLIFFLVAGQELPILWMSNMPHAALFRKFDGYDVETVMKLLDKAENVHIPGISYADFNNTQEEVTSVAKNINVTRHWPRPSKKPCAWEDAFPGMLLKPILEELKKIDLQALPSFGQPKFESFRVNLLERWQRIKPQAEEEMAVFDSYISMLRSGIPASASVVPYMASAAMRPQLPLLTHSANPFDFASKLPPSTDFLQRGTHEYPTLTGQAFASPNEAAQLPAPNYSSFEPYLRQSAGNTLGGLPAPDSNTSAATYVSHAPNPHNQSRVALPSTFLSENASATHPGPLQHLPPPQVPHIPPPLPDVGGAGLAGIPPYQTSVNGTSRQDHGMPPGSSSTLALSLPPTQHHPPRTSTAPTTLSLSPQSGLVYSMHSSGNAFANRPLQLPQSDSSDTIMKPLYTAPVSSTAALTTLPPHSSAPSGHSQPIGYMSAHQSSMHPTFSGMQPVDDRNNPMSHIAGLPSIAEPFGAGVGKGAGGLSATRPGASPPLPEQTSNLPLHGHPHLFQHSSGLIQQHAQIYAGLRKAGKLPSSLQPRPMSAPGDSRRDAVSSLPDGSTQAGVLGLAEEQDQYKRRKRARDNSPLVTQGDSFNREQAPARLDQASWSVAGDSEKRFSNPLLSKRPLNPARSPPHFQSAARVIDTPGPSSDVHASPPPTKRPRLPLAPVSKKDIGFQFSTMKFEIPAAGRMDQWCSLLDEDNYKFHAWPRGLIAVLNNEIPPEQLMHPGDTIKIPTRKLLDYRLRPPVFTMWARVPDNAGGDRSDAWWSDLQQRYVSLNYPDDILDKLNPNIDPSELQPGAMVAVPEEGSRHPFVRSRLQKLPSQQSLAEFAAMSRISVMVLYALNQQVGLNNRLMEDRLIFFPENPAAAEAQVIDSFSAICSIERPAAWIQRYTAGALDDPSGLKSAEIVPVTSTDVQQVKDAPNVTTQVMGEDDAVGGGRVDEEEEEEDTKNHLSSATVSAATSGAEGKKEENEQVKETASTRALLQAQSNARGMPPMEMWPKFARPGAGVSGYSMPGYEVTPEPGSSSFDLLHRPAAAKSAPPAAADQADNQELSAATTPQAARPATSQMTITVLEVEDYVTAYTKAEERYMVASRNEVIGLAQKLTLILRGRGGCICSWFVTRLKNGTAYLGVHVGYLSRDPAGLKHEHDLFLRFHLHVEDSIEILWASRVPHANIFRMFQGQTAQSILEQLKQAQETPEGGMYGVVSERITSIARNLNITRHWPRRAKKPCAWEETFPGLLLKPIMEQLCRLHPRAQPIFGHESFQEFCKRMDNRWAVHTSRLSEDAMGRLRWYALLLQSVISESKSNLNDVLGAYGAPLQIGSPALPYQLAVMQHPGTEGLYPSQGAAAGQDGNATQQLTGAELSNEADRTAIPSRDATAEAAEQQLPARERTFDILEITAGDKAAGANPAAQRATSSGPVSQADTTSALLSWQELSRTGPHNLLQLLRAPPSSSTDAAQTSASGEEEGVPTWAQVQESVNLFLQDLISASLNPSTSQGGADHDARSKVLSRLSGPQREFVEKVLTSFADRIPSYSTNTAESQHQTDDGVSRRPGSASEVSVAAEGAAAGHKRGNPFKPSVPVNPDQIREFLLSQVSHNRRLPSTDGNHGTPEEQDTDAEAAHELQTSSKDPSMVPMFRPAGPISERSA